MPRPRPSRAIALAPLVAAVALPLPVLAQVVPPTPETRPPTAPSRPADQPWLPTPPRPPARTAPEPPEPPPTISARDAAGRVILLDSGAEEAAARALRLDPAPAQRLDAAIDRHRAELARLAAGNLAVALRTLLPAHTRIATDPSFADAEQLRELLSAADALRLPSLLARLEREGILTLQQRQRAQAAVDAHLLLATQEAVASAAPGSAPAAELRIRFLMASGEAVAELHRLLLAAADRWPLIEPSLELPPPDRRRLAAAVAPALRRASPPADRTAAMAAALADLDIEVAGAILRAASPASFVPEQPGRLPTPLPAAPHSVPPDALPPK